MGSDAIAVFDTGKLTPKAAKTRHGRARRLHSYRVDADVDGLRSLRPRAASSISQPPRAREPDRTTFRSKIVESQPGGRRGTSTYIGTLLYGSLATLDEQEIAGHLSDWTDTVLESNRMKAAQEKIAFAAGSMIVLSTSSTSSRKTAPTIRSSAILSRTEKPVGNGDPKPGQCTAQSITPNEHKLALQFGVLDNFFDSGEVSGDGHVWSTAAIGTDYLEKTWQQNYRGEQRTYDYEGVVADGYPLLQKIPDVNEPASGYLWGNLAAHGKTYYHFGEFISINLLRSGRGCRSHARRHACRAQLRAQGCCSRRAACPRSGAAA